MRDMREIADMRADLDDNIREHGWDASIDAAVRALDWVLNPDDLGPEMQLRRYVMRPDAERRAEWIARGGDPKDWPDEPERPTSSEQRGEDRMSDEPTFVEGEQVTAFLDGEALPCTVLREAYDHGDAPGHPSRVVLQRQDTGEEISRWKDAVERGAGPARPDEEPGTDQRCPAEHHPGRRCELPAGHEGLHENNDFWGLQWSRPDEEPTA